MWPGVQITVEVLPAFQIFYATGWEEPVLRVRALSAAGEPQTQVDPQICSLSRRLHGMQCWSAACLKASLARCASTCHSSAMPAPTHAQQELR